MSVCSNLTLFDRVLEKHGVCDGLCSHIYMINTPMAFVIVMALPECTAAGSLNTTQRRTYTRDTLGSRYWSLGYLDY